MKLFEYETVDEIPDERDADRERMIADLKSGKILKIELGDKPVGTVRSSIYNYLKKHVRTTTKVVDGCLYVSMDEAD